MNVHANAAAAILIERDVDVPMRDNARLKADVFRPKGGKRVPALLNLGPYQKDKLWIPPENLEEKPNPLMNWETVNPLWWVPRGYAAVRIDGRGSGKSPGQCEPWSFAESIDFYDAIEWAAAQPWCNGNVGLPGISYFAINQWFVANHQPPSLKAIIPWEGFADIYRDALFHGGILSVFMSNWFTAHLMHHTVGRASQQVPNAWATNTLHFWLSNNLDSGAFRGAQAQWDKITVPLLTVGNWSGMALHLRGNTEAFMRAGSKHKKLRIQAGTHVHPFYTEEGRQDQLRFFDYWLKGIDQRRNGRAAGQAGNPQGTRRGRMARRARMAARTHAMDEVLFRPFAVAARRGEQCRRSGLGQSRRNLIAHLCGDQPRLDGVNVGGVGAGDGRRNQAGHGHIARDATSGH
jgi:predicted acyl esterase